MGDLRPDGAIEVVRPLVFSNARTHGHEDTHALLPPRVAGSHRRHTKAKGYIQVASPQAPHTVTIPGREQGLCRSRGGGGGVSFPYLYP